MIFLKENEISRSKLLNVCEQNLEKKIYIYMSKFYKMHLRLSLILRFFFNQSMLNKVKITSSKIQADLYSNFWDFLGPSQFYGDKSEALHGVLLFPVTTWKNTRLLTAILWDPLFFNRLIWFWNIAPNLNSWCILIINL